MTGKIGGIPLAIIVLIVAIIVPIITIQAVSHRAVMNEFRAIKESVKCEIATAAVSEVSPTPTAFVEESLTPTKKITPTKKSTPTPLSTSLYGENEGLY